MDGIKMEIRDDYIEFHDNALSARKEDYERLLGTSETGKKSPSLYKTIGLSKGGPRQRTSTQPQPRNPTGWFGAGFDRTHRVLSSS